MTASAEHTVALNPVLPGFYPDPSVCRVGERYYLANSTFEYLPGIPIHESTDLRSWHPIGAAVLSPEEYDLAKAADSGGIYAPTLRHHDGRFYIVSTQVNRRGATQFIISATDAAGPWSAPVWVEHADGFDPSLFFHDGRAYWCAARIVDPDGGRTAIWVREFDLRTNRLVGEEATIWTGALRDAVWSEGPHLYEREGWFYLLTAEGGTYRDHAITVARSRRITGPFENCPRNPILTHRHLGIGYPVQNVGHADLVQRTDGTWAAVLLAVRSDDGRHILGRETFVADIVWEDDWPVVNPGHGVLTGVGDRPSSWELAPARIGDALSVRGGTRFAEETERGVVLSGTRAGDAHHLHAALFHRLTHRSARMSVIFDEFGPGAALGLALRQSDAHSIRLEVHAGAARVLERRKSVDVEHDRWTLGDRPLSISADIDGSTVRFSIGDRTSRAVPTEVLSSEVAGGFVGTVWGPYVSGADATARVARIGYEGACTPPPVR